MKRRIDVPWGEIMAGQGEVVLNSRTENECLVIVAYDAKNRIGCLGHAVFTEHENAHRNGGSVMRSLRDAVDEMVKDMVLLGAEKDNIEITFLAGENIPHTENDPVYLNRIDSAWHELEEIHLRCRRERSPDIGRSHVAFDVASGQVVFQ